MYIFKSYLYINGLFNQVHAQLLYRISSYKSRIIKHRSQLSFTAPLENKRLVSNRSPGYYLSLLLMPLIVSFVVAASSNLSLEPSEG